MSTCTDNPALGIIGCGGQFSGELQHCVAKASWSKHPDGRAHISGRLSTIDKLWVKSNEPQNPALVEGLVQRENGKWGVDFDKPESWN